MMPALKRGWLSLVLVVAFAIFHVPESFAGGSCLEYEPMEIKLTGVIKKVVFPGRPNYMSIKDGDEPEVYWVLYLNEPVCVKGDPSNILNAEGESNVISLQLLIDNYDKYRQLLERKVVVRGKLMHSFTGHHHTRVMMMVTDMKEQGNVKDNY